MKKNLFKPRERERERNRKSTMDIQTDRERFQVLLVCVLSVCVCVWPFPFYPYVQMRGFLQPPRGPKKQPLRDAPLRKVQARWPPLLITPCVFRGGATTGESENVDPSANEPLAQPSWIRKNPPSDAGHGPRIME